MLNGPPIEEHKLLKILKFLGHDRGVLNGSCGPEQVTLPH